MSNLPKLLIVDDKQALCTQLGQFLAGQFDVIAKTTVPEGLAELVRSGGKSNPRERFAVAVVDLRFENFELGNASEDKKAAAGLRLVAEARHDRFLEVLLITAHGAEGFASDALERGVFRYIMKGAGEAIEASWLEEVLIAAIEANDVRERWLALFEDLMHVDKTVEKLSRQGKIDESAALTLNLSLKDALTNFYRLVDTKGHHSS
jgi:ActR/RegA family two-component response regulator